jgi:hypothetical protein
MLYFGHLQQVAELRIFSLILLPSYIILTHPGLKCRGIRPRYQYVRAGVISFANSIKEEALFLWLPPLSSVNNVSRPD